MEVVLIDHYDSFSFNVLDWLERGGFQVRRITCDDEAAMSKLAAPGQKTPPLVISPGPRHPDTYPMTLALMQRALGQVPMLGICLGHQMMGRLAGAAVVRGKDPFHGTTRPVRFEDGSVMPVGVYHSLVVDPLGIKAPWHVTACCQETGDVMGLEYRGAGAKAIGWQFHPESFLTKESDALLAVYASAMAPLSMPS